MTLSDLHVGIISVMTGKTTSSPNVAHDSNRHVNKALAHVSVFWNLVTLSVDVYIDNFLTERQECIFPLILKGTHFMFGY